MIDKPHIGVVFGALLLVVAVVPAMGATRTFDFEASQYGTSDDPCADTTVPLFNRAEYAFQTKDYIVDPAGCDEGLCGGSDGSDSLVTAFFSSGGVRSQELRFSWVDPTDDDSWARIITQSASGVPSVFPSPTVHLGVGSSISMDIMVFATEGNEDAFCSPDVADAPLEFALVIRETGLNLPLGDDGGTLGDLEFVGLDSIGGAVDPLSPSGGITLLNDYDFHTVKWEFVDSVAPFDGEVDAVTVTVGANPPVTKSIVAWTGDGTLSAVNDRGTLDSLVIRKVATDDTTTKYFINIDNLVIDAPGITDPVRVNAPVFEYQTSVTVSSIDPGADAVTLYLDTGSGPVAVDSTTDPADYADGEHTFTGLSLTEGDVLTATQTVGAIESAPSSAVTVLSAVIMREDFDGYSDQADFNATWQPYFRIAEAQDRPERITLVDTTAASCPQSALEPAAPNTAQPYVAQAGATIPGALEAGGYNGTDDEPLVLTVYILHDAGTQNRNNIMLEGWSGHQFASGSWGPWVRMGMYNSPPAVTTIYQCGEGQGWGGTYPANLDAGPDGISGTEVATRLPGEWVKYRIRVKTNTVEFLVNDVLYKVMPRTNPSAKFDSVRLGSGLQNTSHPMWYDNLTISIGDQDPFPVPLDSPTVDGPLSPTLSPTTVSVSSIDPTATEVIVYADDVEIGRETLTPPETTKVVNVSSIPNNTTITATQVIGGSETCRVALNGVVSAVPSPGVQSPISGGATTVTVINIDPNATEVFVYVDGNPDPVGTATVSGESTKVVTVTALSDGNVVRATQLIAGFESAKSSPGITVFTQGVGQLAVTLGVRETGGSGPVFANGGVTGGIEWIGHTSTGTPPRGNKTIIPNGTWQTLTWDPAVDPIVAFAGTTANGVLQNGPWYTLENLAFTIDQTNPKAGPYTLYIDNFTNAGVTESFESFTAPTANGTVMFRQPSFSGSSVGLLGSPNSSIVSNARAQTGNNALKVDWAWSNESTGNWLRYTTYLTANLGNPLIRLDPNQGDTLSISFLLCGAPDVSVGNILADGGDTVTVTGVNPAADSVQVYADGDPTPIGTAPGNGSSTVIVTGLSLVDGQVITVTQTVGGAEGCAGAGVTVGDCSQVARVSVTGPLADDMTTVTVINVDPNAELVTVYANDVEIGTALPGGLTTVDVTVSPKIETGQQIKATQKLSGLNGCKASASVAIVGSGENSSLLLCLGVREANGEIEWVGATSVVNGAPQGAQFLVSGGWQTLSVDHTASLVQDFTGDGIITDPTSVTLEHLAIVADPASPDTGPYVLYVDNLMNGATLLQDFETASVGDEVLFQEPTFSGTTDSNLLTAPSSSRVSDLQADTGQQSDRIEFQFVDTGAQRWARVATSLLNPPTVDLTQGVTLRVLLRPDVICNDPFADADGDGDVDGEDFGIQQACFTGPPILLPPPDDYTPVILPGCECFDRDGDDDIDESDVSAFEACASGPGIPANPACDD